jgi:hypothetical protein
LKQLYIRLRDKLEKFGKYVAAKSESGDWHELAHRFDWHCAELNRLQERARTDSSTSLDQIARPTLEELNRLSQRVENIVQDLDVFVSAVDHTVEIMLNNKDSEAIDRLDPEEQWIEQEAAWLLHRWIRAKAEIKELNRRISAAQADFNDVVFDQVMREALQSVRDKDKRGAS